MLAVAVADELNDGLSAIYSFFDPREEERAPGVFAILELINAAKFRDLDYLYLGYWIKHCKKMNYKLDYRPIEIFVNNRWVMAGS